MSNLLSGRFFRDKGHLWPILLVGAVIVLFGCQAREAPLNPGIATFKQELKSCLDSLSVSLMEPVASKDLVAVTAALANV